MFFLSSFLTLESYMRSWFDGSHRWYLGWKSFGLFSPLVEPKVPIYNTKRLILAFMFLERKTIEISRSSLGRDSSSFNLTILGLSQCSASSWFVSPLFSLVRGSTCYYWSLNKSMIPSTFNLDWPDIWFNLHFSFFSELQDILPGIINQLGMCHCLSH